MIVLVVFCPHFLITECITVRTDQMKLLILKATMQQYVFFLLSLLTSISS